MFTDFESKLFYEAPWTKSRERLRVELEFKTLETRGILLYNQLNNDSATISFEGAKL